MSLELAVGLSVLSGRILLLNVPPHAVFNSEKHSSQSSGSRRAGLPASNRALRQTRRCLLTGSAFPVARHEVLRRNGEVLAEQSVPLPCCGYCPSRRQT